MGNSLSCLTGRGQTPVDEDPTGANAPAGALETAKPTMKKLPEAALLSQPAGPEVEEPVVVSASDSSNIFAPFVPSGNPDVVMVQTEPTGQPWRLRTGGVPSPANDGLRHATGLSMALYTSKFPELDAIMKAIRYIFEVSDIVSHCMHVPAHMHICWWPWPVVVVVVVVVGGHKCVPP